MLLKRRKTLILKGRPRKQVNADQEENLNRESVRVEGEEPSDEKETNAVDRFCRRQVFVSANERMRNTVKKK